ncbi:SRPBCC family protein [Phragmitibacter flavus]|uniref:SRPBCC family protein n=1 Tax=Phragmitibacter flavus TaxID=2576071 RepID=A0A5R8KIU8_9BACT|nr:SRPBCC family protein [Phragmitibacter flavus]
MGDPQAETNRQFGDSATPGEVRFVRRLPGPIERVWAYLTETEKRRQWFVGGPMELRVGGRADLLFRHSLLSPDEEPPEECREVHDPGVPMTVRVTRCEAPHLLGITWPGESPEQESEVVFELFPQDEDVRLVLTHRGLPNDVERANVSSGWHIHTALLHARLAHNTPLPLWSARDLLAAKYQKRLGVS